MDLQTFSANFTVLTITPNCIPKLREMILQLAVMGKLVPQDPNDEPASALLKRITREQERLLQEGTIKKPKPLPPIGTDEVPYKLPHNWAWVRIGSIGRIVGGGTPPTNNPKFFAQQDIPWLTPADLYNFRGKYIKRGKRDISQEGLRKSSAQLMPAGTVLFSSRAPIGYVAIAANQISTNQGFKSCAPHVPGMSEYIYYFLKQAGDEINRNASGTTFKEISGRKMSLIPFPLPPLTEQQRIVEKVDELMALCDELDERQKKQDDLRISINAACLHELTSSEPEKSQRGWTRIRDHFDLLYNTPNNLAPLRQSIIQLAVMGKLVPQDPNDEPASVLLDEIKAERERLVENKKIKAFSKLHRKAHAKPPYDIPGTWEWVRFGEVIWCFRGHNPPKSDFVKTPREGYVRFIQITDFKTDTKAVYVPFTKKLKMVHKGEIIMAAYRHIGKLSRLMEGAFNVALCRVNEIPPMSRDFVELLIRTDLVKGELLRESERAHIPSMHSDHLLSLFVPIPPREEQQRILSKVDQLMALCDELESKLAQSCYTGEKLITAVVNQVTSA